MIFVGDDWSEEHHDVYVMDETGQRLGSRRLPEGLAGIGQVQDQNPQQVAEPGQVVVGIETDRGHWVGARSNTPTASPWARASMASSAAG